MVYIYIYIYIYGVYIYIHINNVRLEKIALGRSFFYTHYHHLPVVGGVATTPSIDQPTNEGHLSG